MIRSSVWSIDISFFSFSSTAFFQQFALFFFFGILSQQQIITNEFMESETGGEGKNFSWNVEEIVPSKFELVGIVSYNCPVFISQDDCQQVYPRSETAREKFSKE